MAFNTYTTLSNSLAAWIARDDLSSYIDDFVALGHERLAQEIRIRAIETALSVTISSGVATIPSNYLELKHAYIDGSPAYPLEIKDSGYVYERYPTRSATAKPRVIADDGASFVFGPYPDSNYIVKGVYFKKPTVLSGSTATNEWTDNVPDLLLWACLSETGPFIKDEKQTKVWEDKYQQVKLRVMGAERRHMRNRARISHA